MTTAQVDHWAAELAVMGPGISEAVAWAGLVIDRAEGTRLTDIEGNSYLDLMGGAGVNLIGHSHPAYIAAMTEQLNTWQIGAHASRARLDALLGLAALLPSGLDRVQLYSSGAEAVESAIRVAKSATGKFEILSFWGGFHGRTAAALAATGGARTGLGPAMPGVHTTPYANCYRCPLKTTYPGCGLACVDHARDSLREQSSGSLAAILVEPVQGRSGNVVPPPGYLTALHELAAEHDALLICDESMTGLGRTGTALASQHDDVTPDIAILGKGLGNGYPVSAVAAPTALMEAGPYGKPSASSSSYGGFPLACAAVSAVTRTVREERLADLAATLGATLLDHLRDLIPIAGIVGDIRGRGLAIGIELVTDQTNRKPLPKDHLRKVFTDLLNHGVLVMTGGSTLRLYPPLTATADELDQAADALARVLATHNALAES
ncbi:aspartate aminotransferase family protein [Streptacidiphilus sp. P02-A3a]|uniref:aspartate aminotransferase family protein n=1 Tax=Streptacidiphilus sp. P02-A3a TaxID=2704468 RepID=UPI0015FE6AED|nr:aspartate aminotransferase family protein [Streptacidiphilus sp. P02-A3a]QMU71728.1 aspartate aminotransferase family protein [Streptacidiphilus sp. P02-A3a]